MEAADIQAKVVAAISDQVGEPAENITVTDKLVADLWFDELDTVDLVMTLEEEFSIDIDDDEMVPIEDPSASVQAVIDLVTKKVRP